MSATPKAEHFRALHVPGSPLVLFNIWDAGSAKAVAAAGAQAIATGSWSVAAANGYADGEHVPLDGVIANVQRIVGATTLPVTIDLESGYGEDAAAVGRTIARTIGAGAIGCNLEDSDPRGGALRDTGECVARLASARRAADRELKRFFINARTDVFLLAAQGEHDGHLVNVALERARAFADAGADGLFVPGLVDPRLVERIVKGSALPVNTMVMRASPPLSTLAGLGVARVSHGPGPYLDAMKRLEEAARGASA